MPVLDVPDYMIIVLLLQVSFYYCVCVISILMLR